MNNPAYCTYCPVHSIDIARHLSFCLGNAVTLALWVPRKECALALQKAHTYLEWELESPSCLPPMPAYTAVSDAIELLINSEATPTALSHELQVVFLLELGRYLRSGNLKHLVVMQGIISELQLIL